MKTLQRRLGLLADNYAAAVAVIADEMRVKYVIPFCDRTGLHFLPGNGAYCFLKDGSSVIGGWNDYDGLPKRVRLVLDARTLYRANDLGSVMEPYKPKKVRAP